MPRACKCNRINPSKCRKHWTKHAVNAVTNFSAKCWGPLMPLDTSAAQAILAAARANPDVIWQMGMPLNRNGTLNTQAHLANQYIDYANRGYGAAPPDWNTFLQRANQGWTVTDAFNGRQAGDQFAYQNYYPTGPQNPQGPRAGRRSTGPHGAVAPISASPVRRGAMSMGPTVGGPPLYPPPPPPNPRHLLRRQPAAFASITPRHRPPPANPSSLGGQNPINPGLLRYGFAAMEWRTVASRSVLQFLRQRSFRHLAFRACKTSIRSNRAARSHARREQGLPTITRAHGTGTGTTRSPDQQQSLSGSTSYTPRSFVDWTQGGIQMPYRNQFEQYTQSLAMAQPWNPSFRYTQGVV